MNALSEHPIDADSASHEQGMPLSPAAHSSGATATLDSESASSESFFEIRCITDQYNCPRYLGEWRRLILQSKSEEKIYQTPEFFRFLVETSDAQNARFELYAIIAGADGAVVGIVPVRARSQHLRFFLLTSAFASPCVRLVTILGSVPLLPDDSSLVKQVFRYILDDFPAAVGLCMPALPSECRLLSQIQRSEEGGTHFIPYVIDGWRECHITPLPRDFDNYLKKMSAKRRYNLSRQVRLLVAEAGDVEVMRISHPEDVAPMMMALTRILGVHRLDQGFTDLKYQSLAANSLLLSYVIFCGETPVAVVLGTRSADAWHVHQIHTTESYRHLSIGTSAVHLALRDVIENFSFVCADFGYGTPGSDFRSTHVLNTRGTVLLCLDTNKVRFLFGLHSFFNSTRSALVNFAKPKIKKIKNMVSRLSGRSKFNSLTLR